MIKSVVDDVFNVQSLRERLRGPKNSYRVPKKQWERWNICQRDVFNRTYIFMLENQGLFHHPKQKDLNPQFWKTTCWNAAWIAADAVVGEVPPSKTVIEVKAKPRKKKVQ
ncbi:MAG: hypothetical protein HRU82_02590 [Nitrospira sp.]|nr:MAG: hypothetical protein HRU82_02590 [Nitrospira sp.]